MAEKGKGLIANLRQPGVTWKEAFSEGLGQVENVNIIILIDVGRPTLKMGGAIPGF